MAYYTLALIKSNLEILPSDTSLDSTFDQYGKGADEWVNAIMGHGTELSSTPTIYSHVSSLYAAGRFLFRVKEEQRGKTMMEEAEKQLREYKKGPGFVAVFG